MALTLGFTGMDSATEAALKAAFEQANASLGNTWRLVPDAEASTVIVDMDSMYGPMSWLRLHAAGKRVVGLTSAPRTQTDFHLTRPFDGASVSALLQAVASDQPAAATAQPTPTPNRAPAPAQPAAPTPRPQPVESAMPDSSPVPSGMSPSPMPQDVLPEEQPLRANEEAQSPSPAPRLPASVEAGTLAPTTIQPAPVIPHHAAAPTEQATPTRDPVFADWLAPGALSGRFRYRRATDEPLWIDANARHYYSTTSLKPLISAIEGRVGREDFQPVDAATWARDTAPLGAAQSLNRLQWFGGLVAGKGHLLPEYDTSARYKLTKWPQTEREFPKHFRIATAMMKGPATLAEVAQTSGVSFQEVADFVNASLITGFAEAVSDTPAEPVESSKSGGLFGRRRGK
jgi:hypothetical protein